MIGVQTAAVQTAALLVEYLWECCIKLANLIFIHTTLGKHMEVT